jgi:signal transduction histidine kinase
VTTGQPARRAQSAIAGGSALPGGAMMTTALDDRPAVIPPRHRRRARQVLAGVLVPTVTVIVVVIGLRIPDRAGLPALQAVAFGLVLVGALSAVILGRAAERVPLWQAAAAPLAAAVALAAVRFGSQAAAGQQHAARAAATLGILCVIAIWVHLLLALPDGRLGSRGRQFGAAVAYTAAVAAGLGLTAAGRALPAGAVALIWPLAAACALPAVRLRYLAVTGRDRERMQWLSVGAVLAADAALVTAVLHVLVGWPEQLAAVAAGCAIFLPVGMILGEVRGLASLGGRVLVQVLSIAGFTTVVAGIYLVIVFGIGTPPSDSSDREVLGLSMLAAAVAAIGYLPARDRLIASATRFVYGAREAPDEALRTFGSRLTRAIPMDELLLQLAESLRKTMSLTRAEVYTGAGDVLERAVSVPDARSRSIIVTGRERPVVTRAGVSGNAWTSVWLPALLEDRELTQIRVAPVSHGGALLGLIVVERPAAADAFSEDDDRVLTELARQVGLAFHNAQLDAALQTTLDELRGQAEALRESRARIVASGDAERRRVERNLHDGAQQNLVALAVNLRLAREIVAEDPGAAGQMLDEIADEVKRTIQDLRELAHGIYPPLLADSGLGEALRAAAGRSPLAVEVTAAGIGRYSPEIEAAVYFCCLEALQNAAKHAPDASVQLRLWEESGGLLFSVTDNGPGYDAERAGKGHGFVNMADRLGAIGGTVRWQSEPGRGAQIRGSIPLT